MTRLSLRQAVHLRRITRPSVKTQVVERNLSNYS